MIGHLYRYPHPYDSTRFIYVGQGLNRDKDHRFPRSSFGRRFKKKFPGIELPLPLREEIDVESYSDLNEQETIWMFRFRTWHGYLDGMNLMFPGSLDYKNLGVLGGPATNKTTEGRKGNGGRISGRIVGRRNVENGHLRKVCTFEVQSQGGRIGGRKTFERCKGLFAPEHLGKGGRRCVENGSLAITQKKYSRINGLALHEKKLGIFSFSAEQKARSSENALHTRWHVKGTTSKSGKQIESKPNPRCVLCSEQSLIIAYA